MVCESGGCGELVGTCRGIGECVAVSFDGYVAAFGEGSAHGLEALLGEGVHLCYGDLSPVRWSGEVGVLGLAD